MNKHEAILYALCGAHILVWLVIMFGGLASRRLAVINVALFLPAVFLVQCALKTHVFIRAKTQLVLDHPDSFDVPTSTTDFTEAEELETRRDARQLGYDVSDVRYARRVFQMYEDRLVLPRLTHWLGRRCALSFQNPVSAQGMLVVAYAVNAARLLWCR